MVGAARIELATSWSQTKRATAALRPEFYPQGMVPLGRLERPHLAPEASALSAELQGPGQRIACSQKPHNYSFGLNYRKSSCSMDEKRQGGKEMKNWIGVILAAGKGKRMNSGISKPLHEMCGKPLIKYTVDTLIKSGISNIIVIVSPTNHDAIKQLLGTRVRYVIQEEALGTGHALLQCSNLVADGPTNLMVTGCDSPLLRHQTLTALSRIHVEKSAYVSILTAKVTGPTDLGIIKRDGYGNVYRIVETHKSKNADSAKEVNSGTYCFDSNWITSTLTNLRQSNVGEYYLTDSVESACKNENTIASLVTKYPEECLGINNRIQLAHMERILRQRIREKWMLRGVTMLDPNSTFIDSEAWIGKDSIMYPNTYIHGKSKIGSNCTVGPGSFIKDSTIGDSSIIISSFVQGSILEDHVTIGPFSHLRPGSYIERKVHIGNFGEIKESRLGEGVKMGHFGYVGDTTVGAHSNLGAGLVTCNFDGRKKHKTQIGEKVFIGSDTILVAPVSIGDNATTGAGSVITKNVPAYRLAIGIPAKIKEKPTE